MVPAAVVVEAVDELDGGLVAELGGAKENDFRIVTGDGGEGVRQIALAAEIIGGGSNEEGEGVVFDEVCAARVLR